MRSWLALPILLIPAFSAGQGPHSKRIAVLLRDSSPGSFFPLNWGDGAVRSGPKHCRSAPESQASRCRLNAELVDRLQIRLQDVDWEALGRRADRRLAQIRRCLKGRSVADAGGCYEEPSSNIVTGRFRDQYGGLWRVEAARGVPSEGLLDGPLWANAIVESLGPVSAQLDENGALAVVAPPRPRLAEIVSVQPAIDEGLKNISK